MNTSQDVIVCDQCGAEGCTVKEIAVRPDVQSEGSQARAFELHCIHCGHTQYLGIVDES